MSEASITLIMGIFIGAAVVLVTFWVFHTLLSPSHSGIERVRVEERPKFSLYTEDILRDPRKGALESPKKGKGYTVIGGESESSK